MIDESGGEINRGTEFHKDFYVLENDQKLKLKLIMRIWWIVVGIVIKNTTKKGHRLLTSIRDDLGEDKYSISPMLIELRKLTEIVTIRYQLWKVEMVVA